jgi:hypothetical protein
VLYKKWTYLPIDARVAKLSSAAVVVSFPISPSPLLLSMKKPKKIEFALSLDWLDYPLYELVDFLERPEYNRLKN